MSNRSKYIWSSLGIAAFAMAFFLEFVYWDLEWKHISLGRFLLTLLFIMATGLLLALVPYRRTLYKDKFVVGISMASMLFLVIRLAEVVDFEFGLSDQYNHFTAKQDLKNGKVQIISIGFPMPTGYEEEEVAIERGFGYKSIWGCTYSSKGYYWYNAVVYKHLDKINGKGWQDRLRKQLDSLRYTRSQNYK